MQKEKNRTNQSKTNTKQINKNNQQNKPKDCCSDLFCQNWRSFNKQQRFCKCNRTARSRGTRLLTEGFQPSLEQKSCQSLPTCCLELFGCCCRGLFQHGVGGMLFLLWWDAFFCVYLDNGSFCQDSASLSALCCFGLLMRCLLPVLHSKRGSDCVSSGVQCPIEE